MIYFFINILMYLLIILLLIRYFINRMNIISFCVILFNMNVFLFFIYQNINFLYGILVSIVSIILLYFIELFNKDSKEIVLIKDGNINFHELINNYSYFKLISYLKLHHYHLDEIAYCIKKNNHLTIIKNKNISFPISLILDGKLINENLSLINKSEEWLKKELLKRNLLIKNVDYAYFKQNKIYFVNN